MKGKIYNLQPIKCINSAIRAHHRVFSRGLRVAINRAFTGYQPRRAMKYFTGGKEIPLVPILTAKFFHALSAWLETAAYSTHTTHTHGISGHITFNLLMSHIQTPSNGFLARRFFHPPSPPPPPFQSPNRRDEVYFYLSTEFLLFVLSPPPPQRVVDGALYRHNNS